MSIITKDEAEIAVKTLLEKKGLDVRLYDVADFTSVTDYYVNVTARSGLQVLAFSDAVEDEMKKAGFSPLHVEGRSGKTWVLLDFGNVIVNIFDKQSRDFYGFDRFLPPDSLVNIDHCIQEIDNKFDINRKDL